jgi:DNA repair exonuclease SbcCD nuclease subunit
MTETEYDVSRGLTSLVIGDPHFKSKNALDGLELVERVVNVAKTKRPTFIVILGDILDTHEVVRVAPHKMAASLIEQLSQVAPTYVLVGNHDLLNNSQFLSDNHIFTPMKKWKNVFVADTTPLVLEIEDSEGTDRTFVFCPYTPNGRFSEALDILIAQGYNWQFADCIFAHQEFEGCKMDQITSEDGDKWDDAYPPVISGHIHDAQVVGTNIFYTGTPIQHSFGESSAKRVWFVNWEPLDDDSEADPDATDRSHVYLDQGFDVEKINLGMKAKKIISSTVEELMANETDPTFINRVKSVDLKIKLTGTSDEFKQFRRSKLSATLKKLGVKFAYSLVEPDGLDAEELLRATRKDVSFHEVFRDVVSKRPECVQGEYRTVFGGSPKVGNPEGDCVAVPHEPPRGGLTYESPRGELVFASDSDDSE